MKHNTVKYMDYFSILKNALVHIDYQSLILFKILIQVNQVTLPYLPNLVRLINFTSPLFKFLWLCF